MSSKDTVVIALGGNALLKRDDKGTFDEQFRNVQVAANGIANLIENEYRVVLTHGNGPQVGSTLIRHDSAKKTVPPFPLHACNAETQGFIGYMVVQALQNELDRRNIDKSVVALVSRVVVDENDPSFRNPTKPIGPYFERSQYANLVNIFEGYRSGAKYVNPNVKVTGSYLGDWDSPEKGKEAALLQINSGADFILHVADTSGKGVIEAANDKGVFAFGAVGDQHKLAPKAVLTSFVLDIDKAFDQALQMVAQGRFEGKIFKPGIEAGKDAPGDGIVYLAPFYDLDSKVPSDVKIRLKKLLLEVMAKRINIPEKYTVTIDSPKVSSSQPMKGRKLRIALVTDALFSDGGWGATAYNAAKQLETKYGHEVTCLDNISISDIEPVLRSRANEGYDLIIAHGFQWGDPAVKVGKDYPNTKFVVFTGLVGSENVASIFPMQHEGTFLLGALAGMMTKTNMIGYVGGDQLDPFIGGDSTIIWKYQSNAKYRRVVPSPKPIAIVDRDAIRSLIDSGFIVVACGGGGIPVVEKQGGGKFGVDAVIDKDLASAFLARQIGARKFVILTDVEGLYLDYKKPTQRLIKEIFLRRDHIEISQLEEGSMGPKVQACLQFVKNGGQEAIIARLEDVQDAVNGISGTHFFP